MKKEADAEASATSASALNSVAAETLSHGGPREERGKLERPKRRKQQSQHNVIVYAVRRLFFPKILHL